MSTPDTIIDSEGEWLDDASSAYTRELRLTELIHGRAMGTLASTPMEEGEYIAHGLWGHELAAKLADPDEREGIYLLDVRSRDAYDEGHIQDAHHVDFTQWASPENLQTLPRDRKILVICDTGLGAAQVVAGLRLLGFDAAVPKTGINGWRRSDATELLIEEINAARYPVKRIPPGNECAAAPGDAVFDMPEEDEYEAVAIRAREVFAGIETTGGLPGNVVRPAELQRMLVDRAVERPFLLDLRREEDFEGVGHIEGSLRMDFDSVLVPENLEQLPKDRKIVTVCYTGNLAAQLALVLRMLGYEADALAYGMVGWTRTPTTYMYLKDIQKADNPLV